MSPQLELIHKIKWRKEQYSVPKYMLTLILGFHRDVNEICAVMGCYAASCGNCLPKFRGHRIGPIFTGQESEKERKPAYNVDSGKYGGVAISRRDDSQ
jgi:hypothetical protein